MRREQNVLEVWADHRRREVRFGADKGLQIEPVSNELADAAYALEAAAVELVDESDL